MSQVSQDNGNRIAIVGMAGRFPGARDVEQFWRNLREGVESISFFSDDALRAAGVQESLLRDPAYVKAGGVLDDVEMFDAELFGFTPREAEITDPQHRLFLECAWEALEHAGYDSRQFAGRIGVYAGAGSSSYLLRNLLPRPDVVAGVGEMALFLGNNKDFVPTRVCYKLDLKGPGINVNTACSSSLVAAHVACHALLDYQCDMALAGGAGIQLPQQLGYLHQEGGIGSPDGHCRAFDARAGGTVSGNGVGVVVLKRLEDALQDRDFIHAVILGSAVNNDGADKVGYTAPSVTGQAEVIAEALALAGVEPRTIRYIEAHGTGTRLGDPIEIAALTQAMGGQANGRGGRCAIGSVKTNVGHLDEAAGVAGLIKTVLALRNGLIPPSLHYEQPNPEIDFPRTPFFVNSKLLPWPTDTAPRRAGVSSFGIGGTNAHLVLEAAPVRQPTGPTRPCQLLTMSAGTNTALAAIARNLANHLEANPDQPLADVCYTLQVGRTALAQRRAVVCHDTQDAVDQLRRIAAEPAAEPLVNPPGDRPVAFLFPGQGAQHVGMGHELYQAEPEFRAEMDHCAERLAPRLGCDLRELLYPGGLANARSPAERQALVAAGAESLSQTAIAQPALFSFQYALARLWISWGVQPQAMLGHSLGQYVAATLSGVLTLDDALDLVAARGRLLQQVERGGMLAVGLPENELLPLLGSTLALAAVNSPSLCVASGPLDAIAALEELLKSQQVFHRRLETSHAFHSTMVQPAVEAFRQIVRQVDLRPPQIPFLSNVSGTWITADEAAAADYWAGHMRDTVRFSDNVQQLLDRPHLLMLEIGPGQSLATNVKRHAGANDRLVLSSTGDPRSRQSELAVLMAAVGQLWEAGGNVDWSKFHANQPRQRLPLPTYPFQRQRYWIDPPTVRAADTPAVGPAADVTPEFADDLSPEFAYVKDWVRVPAWRWSETRTGDLPDAPARWLVFVDEAGVAKAVIARLRAAGNTVVEVAPGDRFERLGPDAFHIAPASPADYAALCDALLAEDRGPSRVLHLWNVTRRDVDDAQADVASFYSLLFLAQAIGARHELAELRIDVISNGLHRLADRDRVCAEKALLLGPVRVTPLEYPHVRCRSIDVVLEELEETDSGSVNPLIDHIVGELSAGGEEPVVALRGNHRGTPVLEPVEDRPASTALRQRGVYLITGGMGSMGLALAQHLAERVRARLVLIGRSLAQTAPALLPAAKDKLAEWELRLDRQLAIKGVDSYGDLEALLNELCAGLAWQYLRGAAGAWQAGESRHRDGLRSELNVLPQFGRFFERLLSFVAGAGIVEVTDDVVTRTTREPRSAAETVREIERRFPRFAGLANLVSHCAGQYGPALSGEIEAISVLYPDGTSTFLDECLQDTAECTNDRLYMQLAADILADLPSSGGPLRILEVGGGSGSLTRLAVDRLRGREVEYWFTDIGRSFVVAAQREAAEGGIDFMRFAQLDISRDPGEQGFVETGFDAVVGYNVVHATPDIARCTGYLAGMLKPGGLLMLAETVRPRRWIDMIWGLAEAWWCYEDESLRGAGPLMDLDAWERALEAPHFEHVLTLPETGPRRAKSDSGLVLAQRTSRAASPDSMRTPGDGPRRTRQLEKIAQAGGEVLVIQADVTNRSQMQNAVAQARERFGAIHGVIHAAGVLGQQLIRTNTAAQARAVLAPKVAGTRVLEEVLDGHDIDFFASCASLASNMPIVGQTDYCAANAFLDAFAQEAPRGNTRRVTIDWGFWQELGMIEKSNMPQPAKQAIVDEIQRKGWSGAGVAVFEHILRCGVAGQVLVSPEFAEAATSPSEVVSHPWFESRLVEETGLESYVAHLSPLRNWVLDEHRVHGKPTLPGTAYLEMARAAFACSQGDGPVELRNVYFLSPLVLEDGQTSEIRTVLKPQAAGCAFHVVSRVGADRWQEHARGEILRHVPTPGDDATEELAQRCRQLETAAPPDDDFADRVAAYPPRWRNIMRFQFAAAEGLARFQLPARFAEEVGDYGLHPALLDNATGFLAHWDNQENSLPFCYQRMVIHRPLPSEFYSRALRVDDRHPGIRKYDVQLLDLQGAKLVEVDGFTMREVAAESRTSRQFQAADDDSPAENFHVQIATPGHLESLGFRAAPRRDPAAGELEIEVDAAGLNFIEVLYALGMLPTPPGMQVRFGLECAGRVSRLGPGVESFEVGDEVFAMAQPAYSRYTLAAVNATARKPDRLSFSQAAALPAAYATAWYALIVKARLRRGERVLIHSATGGVGLAAVNIARHVGAEIFATAGKEPKREFLRDLGIEHVMDSRSLDFADHVLARTGGEGVDVVLNSLGGEFIARSLSVLRRHGRFLELGKRDIFGETRLNLKYFEKHLSFMAIDVGPDLPDFDSLWQDVVRGIQDGSLPPLPHREFPITELTPAMEFMAQARHIGKVVLKVAGCQVTTTTRVSEPVGLPLAEIVGPLEPAARPPAAGPPAAGPPATGPAAAAPRPSPTTSGHQRPDLETTYLAPRNETEDQVADIWQQLLGIDRVGVEDNFFDLRGDSLLAAQLVSRVQRVFQVALPISIVFDATTVASQAERIRQLRQRPDRPETAAMSAAEREEGEI